MGPDAPGARADAYSTVTLLARLRGMSMARPRLAAAWYEMSWPARLNGMAAMRGSPSGRLVRRSEENTSELQSRLHLGWRLLLEKKTPSGSLVRRSSPKQDVLVPLRPGDPG